MIRLQYLAILLFSLLLFGCGSGTSVNYSTPNKPETPIKKVFVIALTGNDENRETVENELVYWLKSKKYDAHASIQYMEKANRLPKSEEIKIVVKENQFDGVITMRLADLDKESRYVSATETRATTLNETYVYNYVNAWNEYYVPGYYASASILKVETNLFETESEKLVFTAESETFEAASLEQSISDLAKSIAGYLNRSKVLTPSE